MAFVLGNSQDSEKPSSIVEVRVEALTENNGLSNSESQFGPITKNEVRRIHRKIDRRILPWLCVAYLFMRIDVSNISNAAILNEETGDDIRTQLHLTAQDWAWAIACFFYPYAFIEPISALFIKSAAFNSLPSLPRPSLWIGRIMVTWGIIVCCMGAVQNYQGLLTTRILLGAAEAGYYPSVVYYLTFWFRPEELAWRIALFYSCGQVSGFVGGFLAYAISFTNGVLPGWRWLFIIEGTPAILMGVVTFFILPDFPETAKFLDEAERKIIIERLSKDAPTKTAKTWDGQQVIRLFVDPTFWTFSAVWFCHGIGGFGLSFVLPTVIYQLGFTTTALSNVLSMPPYLGTFVLLNSLGWLVPTMKWNPFVVAIALEITNIICSTLLLTVNTTGVRYLALLISTAASGTLYPILWPHRIKAARGTTAAGIAIGLTNALSQFSGILGPQVFLSVYGPTYRVSFLICTGLLSGTVVFIAWSGFLMGELGIRNRKRPESEARVGA